MDQKESISIPEALGKLQKICSTQEKCVSDAILLLKRWGVDDAHHEEIISRLQEDHFIDEHRFVTAYVRDKIRFDHWGFIKIHYLLKQKGISHKLILEAFNAIDPDEYKKMIRKELEKKRKTLKGAPHELWAKLARYGSSRGYEMDYMHDLLDEMAPGD